MGLYRRKDSKYWWMTFRIEGKRVSTSTGTSNKGMAAKIYTKRSMEIIEGKWFPKVAPPPPVPMNQLFDRYLQEVSPGLAATSHARNGQMVKTFQAFFGEMEVGEVSTAVVSRFKALRMEKHSPGTVLRELGLLRRIFTLAVHEWELAKENPVSKAMRSIANADNKRVRYLAPEEVPRLLAALPPWLRPIVILARHTGLRRSNLLGLTWEQVKLERRVLLIPRTKNGLPIGLPLNETAVAVLLQARENRHPVSPYVFWEGDGKPVSGGRLGITFRRVCQTAGIENLRFHDLRHDFASGLVQAGVDIHRVKELLGHKDLRMTLRYSHLAPENLADAVRVLDHRETR